MAETMLDRDFLESLKLWRQIESDKEMEGTFQKKDSEETYKKNFKKGHYNRVFKYCLRKVRNRIILKYDATSGSYKKL